MNRDLRSKRSSESKKIDAEHSKFKKQMEALMQQQQRNAQHKPLNFRDRRSRSQLLRRTLEADLLKEYSDTPIANLDILNTGGIETMLKEKNEAIIDYEK